MITRGSGFAGMCKLAKEGHGKAFPEMLILELHSDLVKQRGGAAHDRHSIMIDTLLLFVNSFQFILICNDYLEDRSRTGS